MKPAFGTDERRRILELHKERKKKRKQEKKKLGNSGVSENGGESSIITTTTPKQTQTEKVVGSPTRRGKYDRQNKKNNINFPTEVKDANGSAETKPKKREKENGMIPEKNQPPENNAGTWQRGRVEDMSSSSQRQTERGRRVSKKTSFDKQQHANQKESTPPPPPGLGLEISSTNGNQSSSAAASNEYKDQSAKFTEMYPEALNNIPDLSQMTTLDDSKDIIPEPPRTRKPPTEVEPSVLSSSVTIDQTQPQSQPLPPPLPSDALFITVPRNERPELSGQPNNISLAIPAARHFISKYYAHFDGSVPGVQIGDLIRYYTCKAQKSVSIGGAHSVVTGRGDIATQILSLAGAAFVVRGVVAQDTADGKGVHILVTGTARTGLNGAPGGGVVANFAHSVSLIPIDDHEISRNGENSKNGNTSSCPSLREAFEIGYPFQIHNDALAFLTGDVAPVPQAPILQPPMQMQPPPGLF